MARLPATANRKRLYTCSRTHTLTPSHPPLLVCSWQVAVIIPTADVAVSLALSPQDPLLEVLLNVSAPDATTVDTTFTRLQLRLVGGGPPTAVTSHIVGHAADWRPVVPTLAQLHPHFHVPPYGANVTKFAGLGSYSWNQQPYDVARAQSLGFHVNWDLSGTFMYAWGEAPAFVAVV